MSDTTSAKQKRSTKRIRREATAEQRVLSIPQTATILGKSDRATWQDVYRGRLPYRRHAGKIIVLRDELEEFLRTLPGITVEQAAEKVAERAA
jgi:hypothetical protein